MAFDGKNPWKLGRQMRLLGGLEIETLAAGRTLTHSDAQYIGLDPGGAHRNVVLPAPRKGSYFFIFNRADAAENLVVQQADASTTCATINQNEMAIVFCAADDEDDADDAWSLMAIIAIALS
jgi:hypothetical protein